MGKRSESVLDLPFVVNKLEVVCLFLKKEDARFLVRLFKNGKEKNSICA